MGLATGGNRARERAGADPEVAEVVAFWRRVVDDGLWMAKDPEFDRDFRDRFLSLHMAATGWRPMRWVVESATGLTCGDPLARLRQSGAPTQGHAVNGILCQKTGQRAARIRGYPETWVSGLNQQS